MWENLWIYKIQCKNLSPVIKKKIIHHAQMFSASLATSSLDQALKLPTGAEKYKGKDLNAKKKASEVVIPGNKQKV